MSEGKGKEPRPRLCQIIKWEDFDGYGFNLHAEKGKPGQFVGKVDEGSPAEAGGLREGDRILEVNGINITEESHKEVVQRIKASPNEALLLVVDAATDTYFKSNNVLLESSHPSVLRLYTPPRRISTEQKIFGGSEQMENTPNENSPQHDNLQNPLNLNMTAKELRAQLAARKKYDPKKDNTIDFKKKYDIVQKL